MHDTEFIQYVRDQLIVDLRDTGWNETADDIERLLIILGETPRDARVDETRG